MNAILNMEISVIIPVFNEEKNIPFLFQRLTDVLSGMAVQYELIFINDGSRDHSMQHIRDLAARETAVKYIDFSRNFGHQIAVMAGIDKARGQCVAIIDADLQDPPELIRDMYQKWKEGFEVVYARRKSREGESALKRWTAKAFYRLLDRVTSIHIPVDTGDFRVIDRKIVDVLRQMPEKNKFLRGQIAWIGFRQTALEYERQERFAGDTGYSFRKMMRLALDGITGFSDVPLKIVTYFGFLVSVIAFFVMLYALYARLILKDYVAGWASIIISVLFIGGIQLIAIGIIGEYLSRMNHNLRNRPLYIIRDTNF